MTVPTTRAAPSWWPLDAIECFDDIVAYRLVGASACADRIAEAVTAVAAESDARNRPVAADVGQAGDLFCGLKPDTALYRNIARALARAALVDGARGVRRTSELLSVRRVAAQREVVRSAVTALADVEVLLVHDYSSMVMRILGGLITPRRVVVTAGEPLGQGPRVARIAAAAGHVVSYTPDTAVGRVIGGVDAFVVGVECFYPDGSLANTVGSLSLGLLCRNAEVPVIAPTELLKCDPEVRTADLAPLDARLLHEWPGDLLPPGVSVVDFVLDPVPAELVTCYATEVGVLTPAEVAAHAESALGALQI